MNKIFVYGILKNREDAQPARVAGYRLADMGAFPAAIPDPYGVIIGELISVSDAMVEEFDRIEGHPNFYARTGVKVCLDNGGETCEAQMYVISQEYWDCPSETHGALSIVESENKQLYEYKLYF